MRKAPSKLLATVASMFIICHLQFSQDFVRECDVKETKSIGKDIGVYVPLTKLYPLTVHKHKVDLSIVIICLPREHYIELVKTTLDSTTSQLQQMSTNTVKLFIGILSQNTDEQEFLKDAFKTHVDKFRIQFVVVKEKDLNSRLNSSDISLSYRQFHRDFIRRRAHITMLKALLLWTASQESRYVLFADAKLRANKNLLKSISKAFHMFHTKQDVFTVQLAGDGEQLAIGFLYRAKSLDVYTEYMFYMAPFKSSPRLSDAFYYFGVSYKHIKDIIKGYDVIDIPVGKLTRPNPPAVHSTNIFAEDPFFSSLPYEKGTKFWAKKVEKNSQFAIKFNKPIVMKSVRIITGLDIYMSDPVTRAVLEESKENVAGSCGKFKELADFRAGYINLKLNRVREVTTCLRVRFLSTEEQWVSIQMIEVIT